MHNGISNAVPQKKAVLHLFSFLFTVFCSPVFAGECGKLCSAEWMSTANIEDVKREVTLRSGLPVLENNACTPLHIAALYNPDPRISELLVEFGSNLEDPCGRDNITPLQYAVGGKFGLARLSLGAYGFYKYYSKYGLDRAVKEQNKLDAHLHATGNNPDVVESLLKMGASVSARSNQGATPLHYAAAATQHQRTIRLLLQYGSDINAIDIGGHTPLHWAAFLNLNARIVRILLDHGANYKIQARTGTSLHYAAAGWATTNIKVLIDRGSNIESVDKNGETPLHKASKNRILEPAKILLDNGAKLEVVDLKTMTPLQHAIRENKNPNIALLLIDKGADVGVIDVDGNSILQLLRGREVELRKWDPVKYEQLEHALK